MWPLNPFIIKGVLTCDVKSLLFASDKNFVVGSKCPCFRNHYFNLLWFE